MFSVQFARTRNNLRRLTRELRRSFEKQLASNIKENPKSFWHYVNSRTKTKSRVGNLKLREGTDAKATTDAQKAIELSKFFSSVYTIEDCSMIPCLQDRWEGPILEEIDVTAAEVEAKLKNLRPASSPGPDRFHPKLLRDLASPLSRPLGMLIQKSLSKGCIPEEWMIGEIVPIFKKGSRQEAANYRPITLTSVLSKICESFVRDRIMEHMITTNQLNPAQYGFMPRRSCVGQILMCLEDWTLQIEKGCPIDITYLDFQKAFDAVPHRRLLQKLNDIGIRGKVLSWVETFLVGRKQRVVVNGTKSDWAPVISGIPQGTVLGPTLFLLYVNDLPASVQSKTMLFANDTKMYTSAKYQVERDRLQRDLDELGAWSKKWELPFNAAKCKSLHLGPGNPRQVYTIQHVPLEQVNWEKDLGICIDDTLKFRKQAAEAVSRANRVLGTIRRTFVHMDRKTLPLLFKTLVRPLLEYGNAVWGPHNKADQLAVERVQRRATKLVTLIRHLPYAERLEALQLPSLQYRRRRGNVILVYQVMHGLLDLPCDAFFQRPHARMTRGHSIKVAKPHAQARARRNHWSVKTVNDWNSLPETAVSAETLNQFKTQLDNFWSQERYKHP